MMDVSSFNEPHHHERLLHKAAARMMAGGCKGESTACNLWAVKHLNLKPKAKSTVANLSLSSKK